MTNGMIAANYKTWLQEKIKQHHLWCYDFERDCFVGVLLDDRYVVAIHRTRGVVTVFDNAGRYNKVDMSNINNHYYPSIHTGGRQVVFFAENEMHNYHAMIAKIEQGFNSRADKTMEIH